MTSLLLFTASGTATSTPSWQAWVAVASALTAVLALIVSFSNRNTARKSLALSQQQEARRTASLDVSVKKSVFWRPSTSKRVIAVRLLVVNASDRDGSVIGAELNVTYRTSRGDINVVKISAQSQSSLPDGTGGMSLPAQLNANAAAEGWIIFDLPEQVIAGSVIQRFDVVLNDSRGVTAKVQTRALEEIAT